ncbi:helix-turn-helix domain-containing protein [Clostridium senegalense]|uniref:helix-turn-helix domain-containing protein n=1 Tax=Clostridium senegalense TaxID=1465809 RepID=UPI000287CCBD|nr:helix-turn-helix transcriptional regulator [Clostridium senegalense]
MKILSLGEKVKLRRKQLDLTLKNLAGDRITAGQISLVESGKSNPSMDLLEYLASALDVTVEYLMETEETQAQKICTYYENIAESKILIGELEEAQNHIEISIKYAEEYKLEMQKGKNLYLKGLIHTKKGEYDKAQEDLLTSNNIFIKNNSVDNIIATFILLGKITLELKAYHSAYSYFQQAEKVYEDSNIGDDFLIGEINYYISLTYFKIGEMDKSYEYALRAEETFKNLDNKKKYGKKMLELAQQYCENNNINEAIKYSEYSLKIFSGLKDNYYFSKIENNLGKIFSDFNSLEQSFDHLYRAKDMREKTKDSKIIETLCNICDNYIKLKNETKAKETLDEILMHIEKGEEKSLCDYYLLKYKVELLEGKLESAENTLIQTLNYVKKLNFLKEYAEISLILGKFYVDNGRENEAEKCLNDGIKVLNELNFLEN